MANNSAKGIDHKHWDSRPDGRTVVEVRSFDTHIRPLRRQGLPIDADAHSARKKKATLKECGFLLKIPAGPTFALVGTIIGLASLTFVFGMGTRVSLQVIYRETAGAQAEPCILRITKMKSK